MFLRSCVTITLISIATLMSGQELSLNRAESEQVEAAVERAIAWLASQQRVDGSFPGRAAGQPGITSLAVLGFLSAGHLPEGKYGDHLEKAIKYALSCEIEPGFLPPAIRGEFGS